MRNGAVQLYNSITEIDVKFIEEAQKKGAGRRTWRSVGRAAAIIIGFFLFGSITAIAASPEFRHAIIRFFTSGVKEEVPYEQLQPQGENGDRAEGVGEVLPSEIGEDDRVSSETGDITMIRERELDRHFTVSYIAGPEYMELEPMANGEILLYTEGSDGGGRTYYQVIDDKIRAVTPKVTGRAGTVRLDKLPGVMSHDGDADYGKVILPEMTFEVAWQEFEGAVLILHNGENEERFDIGSAFGGSREGASIEGMYDGSFTARPLRDAAWVEVLFSFDGQKTEYTYPFLFHLQTGEVRDPLAEVDLSGYPCITDLSIDSDMVTATAMAGADHDSLGRIEIDLASGEITEDKALEPPVSSCYAAFTTSDHTVFYMLGDAEGADGFLYDTDTKETRELFRNAAIGLRDRGFADTYVRMIGHHYAACYREPENEVYLLDLAKGEFKLLEGVPAEHDVNFFWNAEGTVLSITRDTEARAARLAFYLPGTDTAWYFDRQLAEGITETAAGWYGEYGYYISAVSERDTYYLYLYEYEQ